MSKIGKLWTDSVAYVALVAGAGLSIAGNVADTYRTRGAQTDTLDIWLAVSYPALVVLMVELFVSTRWNGTGRAMQAIRWIGTMAIGGMAMRVSWVHLHELLLSRGQAGDVATIGPLAIDSLAIMATALILSGRVAVAKTAVDLEAYVAQVARDIPVRFADLVDDLAKRQAKPQYVATEADVAESVAILGSQSVADEAQSYLDRLSTELDSSTTMAAPVSGIPVSPAAASNRVAKPETIPAGVRDLILAWINAPESERPAASQVDAFLAAECTVSPRTARRWRDAIRSEVASAN